MLRAYAHGPTIMMNTSPLLKNTPSLRLEYKYHAYPIGDQTGQNRYLFLTKVAKIHNLCDYTYHTKENPLPWGGWSLLSDRAAT